MLIRCVGLRSSHTSVRLVPPMIIVRTLVGLSQLTWTWAELPSPSASDMCPTHTWPAPIGSEPVAATPHDSVLRREHVVEDRQVVRGQVPQHVDVGLDQTEVDPHRIDEEDVAEVPLLDHAGDVLHRRRVAVGVVAHQDAALLGGDGEHLLGVTDAGRDRLLDQHVLAGAQGPHGEIAVRGRRSGDGDGLHGRVVEHPVDAVGRRRAGKRRARRSASGSCRSHTHLRSAVRLIAMLRTRLGPQ